MSLALDALYQGDCIKQLRKVEPGSVDLAFADPPFNIGYKYDVYKDKKSYGEYLDWTREWMTGVSTALKPDGTFWVAIGDDYAAEIKMIAQNDLGLSCRSWVIWYYTFGVNCKRKFTRSHTHLFYFVKDHDQFTFNADDPAVRVPSARQLVYADARANSKGRLPDDTWILRPQDIPESFQPSEDTWFVPRVAGTFKQRAGFHGCQMPEQLLGRIIKACSHAGETVLDPFGGSGTTLAVAKKLERRWLGFELSKDYVKQIKQRLKAIKPGDSLDGAENPLTSAPSTANGKQRGVKRKKPSAKSAPAETKLAETKTPLPAAKPATKPPVANDKPTIQLSEAHDGGVIEAFTNTHDGFSLDRVLATPDLNEAFTDACASKGLPGIPAEWNRRLLRLRKSKKLPRGESRKQAKIRAEEMDPYVFASEIAMQKLGGEVNISLDAIFCDPDLAGKFDQIAAHYAPGFSAFQYRWAAFWIRKRRSSIRKAERTDLPIGIRDRDLPRARRWGTNALRKTSAEPGVYVLWGESKERLYIGETFNLADRISRHDVFNPTKIQLIPMNDINELVRAAYRSVLIGRHQPSLNAECLAI